MADDATTVLALLLLFNALVLAALLRGARRADRRRAAARAERRARAGIAHQHGADLAAAAVHEHWTGPLPPSVRP